MAGKDNVIADALSRAPALTAPCSSAMPIDACAIAPQTIISEIIECTKTDTAYQEIVNTFRQGKLLANLPENHPARRLKQVWGQLSLPDDGILVVEGTQLYMPPGAPRMPVLQQLHEGHCGYGKTLQTARDLYYWPSMKYDIRNMIDSCEACQQLRPSKPLEPIITTSASFPMEQISIDLFHVKGKSFMVTADRYSGYIWVDLLCDQGTKSVTDNLSKITRIFGVPIRCRTDVGPQFRKPFDDYCLKQGIIHETSSPYNPRSNGHAEAAVKAAKHLLLKTNPSDFPAALASWRNTSREEKLSPNELMFFRKVRDGKAFMKSHLEIQPPKIIKQPIARKPRLGHDQRHEAVGYQSRKLPHQQIQDHFQRGDRVHVQDLHTKRWDVEACITDFSHTGRTLHLCTDVGHLMRRNRRFVRRQ